MTKTEQLAKILARGEIPTKHDQHTAAIHLRDQEAALIAARDAMQNLVNGSTMASWPRLETLIAQINKLMGDK